MHRHAKLTHLPGLGQVACNMRTVQPTLVIGQQLHLDQP